MRNSLRFAPAAILLSGSALVVHARTQASVPLNRPLDTILPHVPGYTAANQTLSPDEQRIAGMTSYVARAFTRDSVLAFTTLVSYYDRQTHGKTIHSPKNCLPGAGWEVIQSSTQPVEVSGRLQIVNRYMLKNGNATALAYYWYQGRGRVTASEYRVKWNLLRDAALLGHTEEALVRVVVPVYVGQPRSPSAETVALHAADTTATSIAAQLMTGVDAVLSARGSAVASRN